MTPAKVNVPAFHPLVEEWFSDSFDGPTKPQEAGWAAIAGGRDTLIAAPTGSGKTLAAFLWSLNGLVTQASNGGLPDETQVVYVSPLKALGNDIQKNLQQPLGAIRELASRKGQELPDIRVAVRSGDTPASERARMIKHPPHILITTPESLFILLTAERSREFLSKAKTIIVDEIHAVAGDKRGAHLSLSLERFDALTGRRCQRIGLSATQKPIEKVAQLLIGSGRETKDGAPDCDIVDVGHRRDWDLSVSLPSQPLGPIATHEMWAETYDHIAELSKQHRTTLIFVSTRRLVERVSHALSERIGEDQVGAHHGSLSRETRLKAEQGLKAGTTPVVVATASLELGIDIGHVDLVCHLGAPRSFASLLQRVGRSGHWMGAVPKGIVFPLTRDELVQSAAAVMAARAGALDKVIFPIKPLDILAQQIVAISAAGEIEEEDLWSLVKRAWAYRDLTRKEFDEILTMLSEGVASRKGRRSAHIHRDQINGVIKGRRGARLAAITSGGAIPDVADYDVVEEPAGTFVGKVNEDFAIESMAGDVFLLGNTSWRIRRIESGKVRVENAHGQPPSIPFWVGEAPARTMELSEAVSNLREEVESRLDEPPRAVEWLVEATGIDEEAAKQIVEYSRETVAVLGVLPTQKRVVAERFFDEGGGMQLVMHTPFGARVNRAWGLSLRKRFCVNFDFELQAAATDDGIVISLGEKHSFPLDGVFGYLKPQGVEDTLTQALLDSPMFTNRWRWNATRSLALLRFSGGKRVPMPLQRMRAEDLLAAVFPEQLQCQEHRAGPITPPKHPLVDETIANCLHEAMDVSTLAEILTDTIAGNIETIAVDTPSPSAASHEILNSNPYAFLDDAPLEERRARAVALRRTDPDIARGVGALDQEAIEEVRGQAWPDVRDADELHDLLLTLGLLPASEVGDWGDFAGELTKAGRITKATWQGEGGTHEALVAAERIANVEAVISDVTFEPRIELPASLASKGAGLTPDEALRNMLQGWMQSIGPTTVKAISGRLGIEETKVSAAMIALETLGAVLQGRFTEGASEVEWCDRALLARIHRMTIATLRSEIEPVSAADAMRFLFRWQHLAPGTKLHGRDGLAHTIGQLQGLELPAPAWEEKVLPARIGHYDPADLEYLCLSGVVAWGRLAPNGDSGNGRKRQGAGRNTPLGFVLREDLDNLIRRSTEEVEASRRERLSSAAKEVLEHLDDRGASFLPEIAKATGRLPAQVEDALWELVSAGLVTGDGVAGLRKLIGKNRPPRRIGSNTRRLMALPGGRPSMRARSLPVGWSLWGAEVEPLDSQERTEVVAAQLLRRWGLVMREMLAREKTAPPWRELVPIYRKWEAQGEIRGGRFVAGFVGEQFALPQAVESLREVRRNKADEEELIISAADPLNLVGILLPGERISPFSGMAIAFRGGTPAEIAPIGTIRSRLANAAALAK